MKAIIGIIMMLIMVLAVQADAGDVSGISISLVNQDPDPAIAGDIVEVRLGVENVGGDSVKDLVIELDPKYPFALVPGEEAIQTIGSVTGYQSTENLKVIKYRLSVDRDSPAGNYELKVKYYGEGSTSYVEKSLSIDIKNRESAEVIHIDKTTLVPGKQASLKFTINNVGNAPLRDMTFSWENEGIY